MAQYQIKKQFQGKRLVVEGIDIDDSFLDGNIEAKLKAFPSVAIFVEKIESAKK